MKSYKHAIISYLCYGSLYSDHNVSPEPRAVMKSNLSSFVAPQGVITAICGATSNQIWHNTHSGFHRVKAVLDMAYSHWTDGRLTARSREDCKPRYCMLFCSYHSEIWQASRQCRCRGSCQILKRLKKSKPEPRDFETLRDLAVRRLSA